MIEIKNLMFQPLTLHLAGSGKGLHLKPRERRKLKEEDISLEIETAAKRGFVSIIRDAESEPPEARNKKTSGKKSAGKSKPTKKTTRTKKKG